MPSMNSLGFEADQGVGNKKPWVVGGIAALALSGLVLKQKLKYEISDDLRQSSLLPYCEDIAEVFNVESDTKGYAVVGGLPIDAFNHPETIIDAQAKTIKVSGNFDSKLIRENNSTRDFDILLLYKDENGKFRLASQDEEIEAEEALDNSANARASINNQPRPEMSLFNFAINTSLFNTATMLNEEGKVTLKQGYSESALPDIALETWEMVLANGSRIKILNPWEQYWRSMTRFPSGVKTKDIAKLTQMHQKLIDTPGMAEMENSSLCMSYSNYLDRMLEGNSFAALLKEIKSEDRQIGRIGKLCLLATARTVLANGEKNPVLSKFVQQSPDLFNSLIGSK
jgi:hypothetical protein